MRFHVTDERSGGWKLRSWRLDHRPGAFLARLWALFGQPPTEIDDGFSYSVKDSTTGLTFTAYSGSSGPAFGGVDDAGIEQVLDDFEAVLRETRPMDCEFTSTAWDEGEARVSFGWANGRPFERTVR